MINESQFWMGRDKTHSSELTEEIRKNAVETIKRANALIAIYEKTTGDSRQRGVTSGWRPAAINAKTANAAKKSNHMLALAVDIADSSRTMKTWLMSAAGQAALVECGLWMEHPDATPTWVHVQTVPPRSGRRVFVP